MSYINEKKKIKIKNIRIRRPALPILTTLFSTLGQQPSISENIETLFSINMTRLIDLLFISSSIIIK